MINTLAEFSPVALHRNFDLLFDGLFPASHDTAMAVDVGETDQGFEVTADVPGLALEDIEVVAIERKLTIRGERKQAKAEGNRPHIRERTWGKLARTILLPVDIDTEKTEARLDRGVLTVTVPKAAKVLPRKVTVKTA